MIPGSNAGTQLRLVSLNVQRLTSTLKLQQLLAWATSANFDIILLQECSMREHPFEWSRRSSLGASLRWPGHHFWCPGSAHSKGLLTLIKPNTNITNLQLVYNDPGGRITRVDFTVGGTPFSLVNVYGPAQRQERVEFFDAVLPPALPNPLENRNIIMGGDFNVLLTLQDYFQPNTQMMNSQQGDRLAGAPALTQIMDIWDLQDQWRNLNPASVDFTFWSKTWHSGSRLDKWLISSSLQDLQPTCEILPAACVPTDHLPISLALNLPNSIPLGRPMWRLPVYLLHDHELQTLVHNIVQQDRNHHAQVTSQEQHLPPTYHRDRWLNLKSKLAVHLRLFHAAHKRQHHQTLNQLLQSAAQARQALLSGNDSPQEWIQAVETLSAYHSHQAQQQRTARLTVDHLYGDTSTSYFHSLGKPPPTPTIITTIQVPNQPTPANLAIPEGQTLAADAFVNYYSGANPEGVFAAKTTSQEAQNLLLASLPRRLNPSESNCCEGPDGSGTFSEYELYCALTSSSKGKAPGVDGLPAEFYMKFWDDLAQPLQAAFDEAFHAISEPAPLHEFLHGVISLIHKPGKPRDQISSYRPITLLNADIKILAKALAARLQAPLDLLINPTQTAFIQHRNITDNLLYHLALAEHLRAKNHPLWILLSDLSGAYGKINWGYLQAWMKAMGFKETGHIRWATIIHKGSTASIKLNNRLTPSFPMQSGLLQGSSTSPLYWCIALQPLSSYLSSLSAQGYLHLPQIPFVSETGTHQTLPIPASSEFADDMQLPIANLDEETPVIFSAFNLFCQAGGPELSISKSQLVEITGTTHVPEEGSTHTQTGLPIYSPQNPPRLLGIPFLPHNFHKACQIAFSRSEGSMWAATHPWKPLGLNLLARAHVAKQCIASKPLYQASVLSPPPQQLNRMQRVIRAFTASSNLPEEQEFGQNLHPNYAICMLPYSEGGINLVHLPTHVTALHAKFIASLFHPVHRVWQGLIHTVLSSSPTTFGLSSWVVTAPTALPHNFLPPRLATYIKAFAETKPHRIIPPEKQDPYSVLAEPLFFNYQITHQDSFLTPHMFHDPFAQQHWKHIRDVRHTYHTMVPKPPTLQRDLHLVLQNIPPAWASVIRHNQLPQPTWQVFTTLLGTLVRHTPSGQLFKVLSTGNIQQELPLNIILTDQELQQGQPAAVFSITSPQANDQNFFLLGSWHNIAIDPSIWGHGQRPLLHYTVRHTTKRLIKLLRRKQDDAYIPGQGVKPKIWPSETPSQQAQSGLAFIEQQWQHIFETRTDNPQVNTSESGSHTRSNEPDHTAPAWLNLQQPRPPRPSLQNRLDARLQEQPRPQTQSRRQDQTPPQLLDLADSASPSQPVHTTYKKAWAKLLDPTLARSHRITVWRIMHGSLMVNAFRMRLDHLLPARAACCQHPPCTQSRQLETLTHCFLECPAVAPAVDWLLDVWHALSGARPPRTAEVILADLPTANTPMHPLWTRLRVALLGCIWHCRCIRHTMPHSPNSSLATTAAAMAVDHIRHCIWRDWVRVSEGDRGGLQEQQLLEHGLVQSTRAELKFTTFIESWCEGPREGTRVASVDGDESGGNATVAIHLSYTWPKPVPGFT